MLKSNFLRKPKQLNLLKKQKFSFQFDNQNNNNISQQNTASQGGLQGIVKQALEQSSLRKDISGKKLENFVNNLEKVRALDQQTQQIFEKTIQNYKTQSIASPAPLKNILAVFQTANKFGFDQNLLAHTFQYLAKTYKSFPESTPDYGDMTIKEVHESWSFKDMVEDIKYGSKKGVEFHLESLAQIMDSLHKLDYKNYHLLIQVLEKVQRMLLQNDEGFEIDLENLPSNPQIHKKFYYTENQLNPQQILQSQEFQKELNLLNQAIEEEEHQAQKLQQSQQTEQEEHQSQNEHEEEVEFLLKDLKTLVNKQDENINSVAQAIVSVREQYYKMTQFQNVAENDPHFNLQFLQIEELLVENGLISPEEIQTPSLLIDQQSSLIQTTEILENFLAGQNESLRQYYRQFLNNFHSQQQQSQQSTQESKEISLESNPSALIKDSYLSQILLKSAQIATLKKQDASGDNYLSENWAKKLQQDKALKDLDSQYMDLDCDVIYTKAYHKTLEQFKALQPLIEQRIQNSTQLKELLDYQNAFLTIGLTQLPQQILEKIDSLQDLQQQLQQLENPQLQNLLNSLSYFRSSQQYPQLYEQTSTLLQNKSFLFLDEILDSLEFLYINHSSLEQNTTFQSLLQQLQTNFGHFQFMENVQEQSKQKLSTLALFLSSNQQLLSQVPELQQKLDGFTQYYQQKSVSPIREKIVDFLQQNYQSQQSQQVELESINLQSIPEFFRPDYTKFEVQNGQLQRKGLYLLDSQFISLDQQNIVDGRIQFWTELLQKSFNIHPTFVKYLTIDNNQLVMQNSEILQKFAMPTPPILPVKFQYTILETILNSEQDSHKVPEIARILDRLDLLRQKTQQGVEILSLSALEEIKYSLYELSQNLSLLSESTQTQLKSVLNIDNLESHLQQVANTFHQEQQQENPLSSSLSSYSYIGKRLTSELLQNNKQPVQNQQNLQYVNFQQLSKKGYHDYEDWAELLKQELSISQLMTQEVSENNQYLQSFNELNDNNSNVCVIPNKQVDRMVIRPLSYPLNWEAFYLQQQNPEKSDKQQKLHLLFQSEQQQKIKPTTKFIANLQNFKYELRNHNNAEQIPEFLARFEFISELASSHLQPSQKTEESDIFTQALPRDPEAYIASLEKSSNLDMYNADYLQYFLKKAQKKQKIISLWNLKNKSYLKQQHKKLQKGKISRQQFENIKQNINQELLQELKSLEHNKKEEVLLQGPSRKFVDVSLDIQALIQDKKTQIYSRYQDSDYQLSENNLQNFLDLKRFRAEQTVIKSAILLKTDRNLPLSDAEKQYAQLWLQGNLPEYNHKENTYFSYRKLATISDNDKKLLQMFQYSDLSSFGEFALNDLVLEFSQLLNPDLITDFEFKIREQYLKQNWNINSQLLNTYQTSNVNNYWIQKAENLAWSQGQQLNEQELSDLLEMLTILKDKTPKQRQELQYNQIQDKQAFSTFNTLSTRLPLIQKYIQLREKEQNEGSDFSQYKQKENKKLDQIWQNIFETSYQNTSESQLNEFVNNLLMRFHLLSKFPPMSFSNFLIQIISHPNLNPIDRDMIVGFVNVFEPELKLDSQDIVNLAERSNQIREKSQQKYNSQEIKEKIRNSSVFQYQYIFDKLQQQ